MTQEEKKELYDQLKDVVKSIPEGTFERKQAVFVMDNLHGVITDSNWYKPWPLPELIERKAISDATKLINQYKH